MISVIIPTLNEAARIGPLLETLKHETTAHEVIVADGGSDDGTAREAQRRGALVLSTERGRGQQLVAGVTAATGDVLFFLHADSQFPPGGLAQIDSAMATEQFVGGNFHLEFDGDDGFSRWLDGFYAWLRRHRIYYGDSGIFIRRTIYEKIGRIWPIALMEDYDLVRRLEASGPTFCIREMPLGSSSRRFEGRHPVAIVAGWVLIHLLFHLGVSPSRLAKIYNSTRQRSGLKSVPLRPQS